MNLPQAIIVVFIYKSCLSLVLSIQPIDRLTPILLDRHDTKDVNKSSFDQNLPKLPAGSRQPIVIPRYYTATDMDPEHRLWYFREDMGINLHHWHWHLVYPFENRDRSVVSKDRRGELFYYMHQQIVARYNMERFSNNLKRVKRLNNCREPIAEGYFPKMDSLVASRPWPSRFDNTRLTDIHRESDQIHVDVIDLERWSDRIFEAIHQGFVMNESGNYTNLDEKHGIDILGNIVESSVLSPNRAFYGDLFNMGSKLIAYVHDPDHKHLESFSVMGDSGTAMRDPIFYRWHAFITDIFQNHKKRLPKYTLPQLQYDDITITGVQVAADGEQPNILSTFWQQSNVNLSRGMDFVRRDNVFARFTHLQHRAFNFTVNVTNAGKVKKFGTVRIFLGPKTDERGQPMLFREQRLFMVELDKFVVSLNPGLNTIRRRSTESSVTIPFESTFRNLDENRPAAGSAEELEFNFCGCGWPNHMLIPKGLAEGMASQLFVMVSNYEDEKIDQELFGSCSKAASYCGVRDRLYPDRRAMGYPFDRLPRKEIYYLADFLTSNMMVLDVAVRHVNETVQ